MYNIHKKVQETQNEPRQISINWRDQFGPVPFSYVHDLLLLIIQHFPTIFRREVVNLRLLRGAIFLQLGPQCKTAPGGLQHRSVRELLPECVTLRTIQSVQTRNIRNWYVNTQPAPGAIISTESTIGTGSTTSHVFVSEVASFLYRFFFWFS